MKSLFRALSVTAFGDSAEPGKAIRSQALEKKGTVVTAIWLQRPNSTHLKALRLTGTEIFILRTPEITVLEEWISDQGSLPPWQAMAKLNSVSMEGLLLKRDLGSPEA